MTGDTMAKVLDVECPLETGSKEPAEWCDQRCEARHEKEM